MWGSIFDATKELAEKARKAAEELERNLNDSAGIPNATSTTAAVTEQPSSSLFYNNDDDDDDDDNEKRGQDGVNRGENDDVVDDSFNDAWDDEDIDVNNIDNEEPEVSQQQDLQQNQEEETIDITNATAENIVTHNDDNDVDIDEDVTATAITSPTSNDDNIMKIQAERGSTQKSETLEEEVGVGESIVSEVDTETLQQEELQSEIQKDVTEVIVDLQQQENTVTIDDSKDGEVVTDLENDLNPVVDDNNCSDNNERPDNDVNHNHALEIQQVTDDVDLTTTNIIDNKHSHDMIQETDEDHNDDINRISNSDTEFVQQQQVENEADDIDGGDDATSPSTHVILSDMISTTQEGIGLLSSFFGGGGGVSNTSSWPDPKSTIVTNDTMASEIPSENNPTNDNVHTAVEDEHETEEEQKSTWDEDAISFDDLDNNADTETHEKHSDAESPQEVDDLNKQQQKVHDVEELVEESKAVDTDTAEKEIETVREHQFSENVLSDEHENGDEVRSNIALRSDAASKSYNDDQITDLELIIEKILSSEESRRLLDQKYLSLIGAPIVNVKTDDQIIEQLQEQLHQREQQLFSKTEQITMMESMHENEKQELLNKINSTKDEAKRRIQKAKERVDAVEVKLKNISSQQNSTVATQEEKIQNQAVIISELRMEGEKLAQKQADMELIVRTAKGETRELRKQIIDLEEERNLLSGKLGALEIEYKNIQNDLSLARQGISQVDQLDSELRSTREANEKRATTILTLEQQVKELKATNKELENELKVTRKGAAIETEHERKRLIMEHNQLVSDLELKLQATEREAAAREDALRQELDDLRKRWQDAIRRADTLSVDIQANTAPLLRQIESINKQSRMRATAWAELETQLRNEIENSIIGNEALTKECNEWKVKFGRLDRSNKEYEAELKRLTKELSDKNDTILKLQHQCDDILNEINQLKASKSDMERLSNEGMARVRSEMTRTMVDNEERHRMQVEFLEQELQEIRNQRSNLEAQLKEQQNYRRDNDEYQDRDTNDSKNVSQQKYDNGNDSRQRLRQSEGQAQILAGALGGLGGGGDEDDDDDDDDTHNVVGDTGGENAMNNGTMTSSNSYAAYEELTSRLKASKMELSTLRTRLMESEKVRNELVLLLEESRVAREQLPIYEQRVQELTIKNNTLRLEINGLKDDISDIREMYRTQLNVLIEERAAIVTTHANSNNASSSSETIQEAQLDMIESNS